MEKKLLKTTSSAEPASWTQFKTKYAIYMTCVVVISAGIMGFFLGRVSERCERHVGVVNIEEAMFVQEMQSPKLDETFSVNVAVLETSRIQEVCLCTTGPDVALLKDAHASSEPMAMLKKGQCFRYLDYFRWQTGDLVFYRLLNPENNQVGWISREFLHPSDNCSSPYDSNQVGDLELRFAGGLVSQQCLQCICNLESGCRPIGCVPDMGSRSCGYFQIKDPYWSDCGKPGPSLEACGKNIYCSSLCVQRYMARYAKRSGCPASCETYAREHNGGPVGCRSRSTLGYWNRLIKQQGCHNPVNIAN